MFIKKGIATLFIALSAVHKDAKTLVSAINDPIISINGSGTTNPSKMFWHIMSKFEDRAGTPVRLSYRAVGSGTGIKEFKGQYVTDFDNGNSFWEPVNDFGSGDIPIPENDYRDISRNAAGSVTAPTDSSPVQLPFAVGGVSFFYNIKNVGESESTSLKLDACLLAKIFKRKIIYWDHDDVVAQNPGLKDLLSKSNYPIKVGRRVNGSSSTASITAYFKQKCPEEWCDNFPNTSDCQGGDATYNSWPDEFMKCDGSGPMTDCIRANDGSIGYIDSGHGWEQDLPEIELKNEAGNILSSKKAHSLGGIVAAASNPNLFPESFDNDFSKIDLLNKEGENTWPIVVCTYVYVRKDISMHPNMKDDTDKRGLLKIFLESLYDVDDDYVKEIESFGFTVVPPSVRTKALDAIQNTIKWNLSDQWIFETDTLTITGQKRHVISSKRRSFAEYQNSLQADQITDLKAEIYRLEKLILQLTQNDPDSIPFTKTDEDNLDAAIVLSSLAFAFWGVTFLGIIFYKFVLNL